MNFKHEIKNNKLVLRLAGDLIGEDNGAQSLKWLLMQFRKK